MAVGLLFIYAASAQTIPQLKINSSVVQVSVLDQQGGTIEGAEVVLFCEGKEIGRAISNNKGVAELVSNASGLVSNASGNCRITVVSKGFAEYKRDFFISGKKKTYSLPATLTVADLEAEVSVEESDFNSIDLERFGDTRALSQIEIDALPDNQEELANVLRQMAGPTVSGAQPTINVNGFPNSQLPPKQAIQKVIINQNIYFAKYDSPAGGGIDVYTKAGMENFSGRVGFEFGDSPLNASNPFIGFRIPSRSNMISGNLQGPIKRKKSSFITYFYKSRFESESVINAVTLNSSLESVEVRESHPYSSQTLYSDARFDYDLNDKHKLYGSVQIIRRKLNNLGVGPLALSSMAFDRDTSTLQFQFSEISIQSDSVVRQTRFQFISDRVNSESNHTGVITDVKDSFSNGGSQIDSRNVGRKFNYSNDVTWQMNGKTLYFGGSIRGVTVHDRSLNNFGGRFIFNGGEGPVLDSNNLPILDEDGNIVISAINSLERYRRTLLFRSRGFTNSQIRALGGGASQFMIDGGEPNASIGQLDVGLYFFRQV